MTLEQATRLVQATQRKTYSESLLIGSMPFHTPTALLVVGECCKLYDDRRRGVLLTLDTVIQGVSCSIGGRNGASLIPWQIRTEFFMHLIFGLLQG